ncbi:UNVERIFIED_CONTAM: hypothetical protein NCL1_40932 [Trichonephila clavipes]
MAAGESYCIMFPGDYFFMLQEESEYNTAEKDGDYTVGFFIQLKEKGQKAVLEWCMSVGLIASKYECPKCGNDMRLCPRKGSIDGFKWRCRRKVAETFHEVSKSIRKDLWRVYDCLSDEDFVNLKDEHSLTYIVSDPSGEHDGTGNSWSSVKEFLKYHAAHSAGHFDAYFAEFIWRWSRDHSFSDDVFRDFIQAVISMFPPPERDIPPT